MEQTFGALISNKRLKKDMSLRDLSKVTAIDHSYIGRLEKNVSTPSRKTVSKLAKALDIEENILLSAAGYATKNKNISKSVPAPTVTTVKVPLLGTIRAGLPLLAEENCHYEVEVPSDLRADFALRVTGDSMSYVGICDGDIAVMRQGNTASHGMIVAAGIEDGDWQATLKFYIEERGQRLLRAANPDYSDIILNGHYKIIGYVVQILKEPPRISDYNDFLVPKAVTDKAWEQTIMTAAKHGLTAEQVEHLIEAMGALSKKMKVQ